MEEAIQTEEGIREKYGRKIKSTFLASIAGFMIGVSMIGNGYVALQENLPSIPDEVSLYCQTTERLANLRNFDEDNNLLSRIDEDSSMNLGSDFSYDIFLLERKQSRLKGSGAFINYGQSLLDYNNKINKGLKLALFGTCVSLLSGFFGVYRSGYLNAKKNEDLNNLEKTVTA